MYINSSYEFRSQYKFSSSSMKQSPSTHTKSITFCKKKSLEILIYAFRSTPLTAEVPCSLSVVDLTVSDSS